VKIGPADLQIICLREITEVKYITLSATFAERAKSLKSIKCQDIGIMWLLCFQNGACPHFVFMACILGCMHAPQMGVLGL